MDKFAVKVIKRTVSHLPWELSCKLCFPLFRTHQRKIRVEVIGRRCHCKESQLGQFVHFNCSIYLLVSVYHDFHLSNKSGIGVPLICTERVIAMSFPSSGKHKMYRNPISVSSCT